MEDALEGEGGADGGGDLGGDIGRNIQPREVAEGGEGDGKRRVEVGAGDVACGKDHYHHSQACACCIAKKAL